MVPLSGQELWKWINNASYEELLRKWRFAKPGSPLFQCGMGYHISEVMRRKRAELTSEEASAISKKIGWEEE